MSDTTAPRRHVAVPATGRNGRQTKHDLARIVVQDQYKRSFLPSADHPIVRFWLKRNTRAELEHKQARCVETLATAELSDLPYDYVPREQSIERIALDLSKTGVWVLQMTRCMPHSRFANLVCGGGRLQLRGKWTKLGSDQVERSLKEAKLIEDASLAFCAGDDREWPCFILTELGAEVADFVYANRHTPLFDRHARELRGE
jgi:hypothetical protein